MEQSQLKSAQEQEDWRWWSNKRDRAWRAAETTEQRSERFKSKGREVVPSMLLKLLLKNKLLHSGKVPVNAELRPLRREKQGTEVQQYGILKEAMKMGRNNLQFLHKTAYIYFPIHSFLPLPSLPKRDWNQWYWNTERTPCNKKAPDWSKPLLPLLLFYHTLRMDIVISMC